MEPAEVEAFTDKDFEQHPELVRGYIGPGALGETGTAKVRYLLDPRVVAGTRWVTGANEPGRHVLDLVAGRDFEADGTIEAAEVRPGDACPECVASGRDGVLEAARGIEIGHIFQLGKSYAEALDLKVLDENGKLVTVTMGSYGIGPSRAVAAIAESTCDDSAWPGRGRSRPPTCTWWRPARTPPCSRRPLGSPRSSPDSGSRCSYDDRPKVSPGVKFKDAELIGVPTIVVVGKGFADGVVEVKDRVTGDREDVAVDAAAEHVARVVRG